MTLSEFFHMGGYATFVWSSYGLTLVVLVLNWWLPRQQYKQNLKKLKRQYASNKTQENKTHDPNS
jgi:heme exporter protein D